MSQIRKTSKKTWRLFMINITLIIIIFLAGIFLGFVIRTNSIIKNQMLTTARSHFNNIVLTRRWNADHGGVYVEKRKGVVSNPYLYKPDITSVDGKVYTKKNPALMTREISEYAQKEGNFNYQITSLNPLNPNNIPDEFEKNALQSFETGAAEMTRKVTVEGRTVFRYMAPLLVEKSCLECHGKQGYKEGDVRGGISVSFDVSDILDEMKSHKTLLAIVSLLTVSLLIGIIHFMIARLARKLTHAHETIELMAITDELTQLYNRRYFHTSLDAEISRAKRYVHSISLLILDIDHFKQVNDNHGHQIGDQVLSELAETITSITRESDIVARYGGEEFAIILPETELSEARDCAEKIRKSIEKKGFILKDGSFLNLTTSIGVASASRIKIPVKDVAQNIIKLADQALYEAKETGRNRVITQSSDHP